MNWGRKSAGLVLLLQELHHRSSARVDVELFKDVFHMAMHRPDADLQGVGDALVNITLAQERQDLLFALGQFGNLLRAIGARQGQQQAAEVLPPAPVSSAPEQFLVPGVPATGSRIWCGGRRFKK